MLDQEKNFIIQCIRKYSASKYNLSTLSEGIISKYTLSRMYHGLLCKEKVYHQLLARLQLYYTEDIDILNIDILFQHIYHCIEINDIDAIIENIKTIEQIIQNHTSHLYFLEMNTYLSLLKEHYIYKKEITISINKLNTLLYLNTSIYKSILYALCENAYYCANFQKVEEICTTFLQKEKDIIFTFWKTIPLAAQRKIDEVFLNYHNVQPLFLEENKLFHLFRYELLIAQTNIRKHPTKAEESLTKIKNLSNQIEINKEDLSFLYYAFGILNIHYNKYDEVYSFFMSGLKNASLTKNIFIPYLYILTILLKQKTKPFAYTNKKLLNKESEHLYHLYKQNKKSEMLHYSIHAFPQKICENPYYESLLPLLKILLIFLSEETRQYKKILEFDHEINQYDKKFY